MTYSDLMFSVKLVPCSSMLTLTQTMGPGVFYDYNPEMLSNMEDVIKEEKMSLESRLANTKYELEQKEV